jgi:diaminohydroxyphosphoribosylaminopyrimidine deaminase / 5-amino-6-(5-phosphoribosylamino)uracil reductase
MVATLTEQDRLHLVRALELAELGRGKVSPNPMVGCVIARDGETIGEGFHAELGALHAERAALADAARRGNDPAGAEVFVTLEPCAHTGRQPPCAEALVQAGVARVVYAADDPSAKASGKGPAILSAAGIDVAAADGDEALAARLQNQAFRKHAVTGRPLVLLKSAVTLDGHTATESGDSRWISGPESRALVHRWRAEADAVAIGIGTALSDDPLLTARDVEPPPARQPLRVVFDSAARLPLRSALIQSIGDAPLLVVAAADAPADRTDALRAAGAEVLTAEGDPRARIEAALTHLGGRDVTSLLLEGGAHLAGAFLDARQIDQLRLFVAPLLLGGERGKALLAGSDPEAIGEARRAAGMQFERSGEDVLITARLEEF